MSSLPRAKAKRDQSRHLLQDGSDDKAQCASALECVRASGHGRLVVECDLFAVLGRETVAGQRGVGLRMRRRRGARDGMDGCTARRKANGSEPSGRRSPGLAWSARGAHVTPRPATLHFCSSTCVLYSTKRCEMGMALPVPPTRSGSAHQPGPRPIRGSLRGVAGLPGRKRRKHSQHLRPKILQPILCCCFPCLFQPKHFREAPPSCLCLNKSSEDIWSSSSNGRDSSVQSVYAVINQS